MILSRAACGREKSSSPRNWSWKRRNCQRYAILWSHRSQAAQEERLRSGEATRGHALVWRLETFEHLSVEDVDLQQPQRVGSSLGRRANALHRDRDRADAGS